MTPEQSPLGKSSTYTEQYDPTLLFPIARANAREAIGIGAASSQVRVDEVVPIGPRGEAAVVAARRAERHVHVEPERPRPDSHQRLGRQCAVGRRGISCG